MQAREASPGPQKGGTLKLHWKPAQVEAPPVPQLMRKGTFWTRVDGPQIDTQKITRLFENTKKEVPIKASKTASHLVTVFAL